ncbi:MAG: EamA family transporter [Candidatus Peribacteria bacterium]|nr:MAG: EamA family transporter [Candidatus Peribacteria bacterium]
MYDGLLYLLLLLLLIFSTHVQSQTMHFTKQFYSNRFGAAMLGAVGTVISLYLIAELGASIVVLLGFVEMALILVFAYFFLGERPTRKDLVMTGVVMCLVALGFYFR